MLFTVFLELLCQFQGHSFVQFKNDDSVFIFVVDLVQQILENHGKVCSGYGGSDVDENSAGHGNYGVLYFLIDVRLFQNPYDRRKQLVDVRRVQPNLARKALLDDSENPGGQSQTFRIDFELVAVDKFLHYLKNYQQIILYVS